MKKIKFITSSLFMLSIATTAFAQTPTHISISSNPKPGIIPLESPAPAVPIQTPDDKEIRDLWKAINQNDWHRFNELSLRYQRIYPTWNVPKDMIDVKEKRQMQNKIKTLSKTGNNNELILMERREPEAFTCSNPGPMWLLVDAHKQEGDIDAFRNKIKYIVRNCSSNDRLTALQKSEGTLSYSETLNLIESPGNKSYGETDIKNRINSILARRTLDQNILNFGELLRTADFNTPTPKYLQSIENHAHQTKNKDLMEMLGWWNYKKNNYTKSEEWFKKALSQGQSNSSKEGLLYIYMSQGKTDIARPLFNDIKNNIDNHESIQATLDADKVQKIALKGDAQACWTEAENMEYKTVSTLLTQAWCGLDSGNEIESLLLFEKVQISPESTVNEKQDALKGRIITAKRIGDLEYLADIPLGYGILPHDRKIIEEDVNMAIFKKGSEIKRYDLAAKALDNMPNIKNLSEEDQVIAGWTYFNAGKCGAAWSTFKYLLNSDNEDIYKQASKGFRTVSSAASSSGEIDQCRDRSVKN